MVWSLALSVFTAVKLLCCDATIWKMWTMEKVSNTTFLPNSTYMDILTGSVIVCVLKAVTNNKSLAMYDRLSQRCNIYSTSTQMDLIYLFTFRPEVEDLEIHLETCADLHPANQSGVYHITPVPEDSFDVYCDTDSEHGPWTVIQNRQSNEVDFFRNWDQYKNGFGNLLGNFWLGNEHILSLTRTPCILRIQLESLNGTFGYAEYQEFKIANETSNFTVYVTGFSGNISNALRFTNGRMFTTKDRDNDIHPISNCAETRHGAWWFRKCTNANLNGMYDFISNIHSMYWRNYFGKNIIVPLKTSRMMLKKP